MPRKSKSNKRCYLCGEMIHDKVTMDHWPPAQFFPSSLKKHHNLSGLITLPAHENCNRRYCLDEDYFFVSLGCLIEKTYIRDGIFEDLRRKFQDPKRQALYHQVKHEFVNRTNEGLYLPTPKIGKKFDINRVENIIWKITRGLYFVESGKVLPHDAKKYIRTMDPQQRHPKAVTTIFESVKSQEEKGQYGRIFSYKILKSDPVGIYACGFLFWDQIMFLSMFHSPECTCKDCKDVCKQLFP